MAGIEDILGKHGNHHMRDKFKRFDNRFIRPFLLRNYQVSVNFLLLYYYLFKLEIKMHQRYSIIFIARVRSLKFWKPTQS